MEDILLAHGDIIFFDWKDKHDGHSDHVGIVRAVRDGKVYTTEGNSGNKVSNKEYPIDTEYITAYGSWYK